MVICHDSTIETNKTFETGQMTGFQNQVCGTLGVGTRAKYKLRREYEFDTLANDGRKTSPCTSL